MEGDPGAAELDAALLEALFTESPAGLYILDTDLRVVRFNPAAKEMHGLPESAVLQHRARDFAPGLDVESLTDLADEVLGSGTPALDHLLRGHPPNAEPRQRSAFSVSIFRLRSRAGRVLGLAASVRDVTDREAAAERQDILHEAHRTIGSTLDAATTATELVDVAVPRFADTAVVDLRDDALRGEPLTTGAVSPDLPLRRAAYRSRAGGVGPVPPGSLITLPFPTPFTLSLDDLRPRLVNRLPSSDEWPYLESLGAGQLEANGTHSLVVAPLAVHGTLLGLVGFHRSERTEPFTEDDLRLAGELADRAALNIDRSYSFARERTVATTLQRHLLPRRPPPLPAVSSAAVCLTAGAGGAWYDVLPLSGGRGAFVVGEVSGRGIEAAAAMGRLRTAVQTLFALDLPPDELLERMDEVADRIADEDTERRTVSCLVAVYDPVTGDCTAASAGQPEAMVVGPRGAAQSWTLPEGPPLGAGGGGYECETRRLEPGSLLALYTEGLINGHQAEGEPAAVRDPNRLAKVLGHPDREPEELCDTATYALVDGDHPRDAVLLLARTGVLDEDQVALWTLPSDLEVVRTARELTRRQLAAWQLDDLLDSTELIVSELVTNAIRYGSGPVSLRLVRAESLWCEVSDGNSSAPHLRLAADSDEGGRGLFLVRHFSRRWGLRYGARGKTVWSEQPLSPETESGHEPELGPEAGPEAGPEPSGPLSAGIAAQPQ
jgi:PAS domain S-box-containing protein